MPTRAYASLRALRDLLTHLDLLRKRLRDAGFSSNCLRGLGAVRKTSLGPLVDCTLAFLIFFASCEHISQHRCHCYLSCHLSCHFRLLHSDSLRNPASFREQGSSEVWWKSLRELTRATRFAYAASDMQSHERNPYPGKKNGAQLCSHVNRLEMRAKCPVIQYTPLITSGSTREPCCRASPTVGKPIYF